MRTPDRGREERVWDSLAAWLDDRLGAKADVGRMLAAGAFVHADGRAVTTTDPYLPNTFVWFHRELRDEVPVPGTLPVLYRDDRIVVVDKPPFLSTIPRGRHVLESVVVRLRRELDLPELSPAHRLDRITSGVLVLTTERRWRPAYQTMFERRAVAKTYRALAPALGLAGPVTVRNHIHKERGEYQARIVPDAPVNAETVLTEENRDGDLAVYRLDPLTGKTHQLRLHLYSLGAPIVGDPLYPEVLDVPIDDFSTPLQLLASEIAFDDPVDGTSRRYRSGRSLPIRPGS